MSWFGQVWHVATKDMRQTAWAGVLVLVGLALATHQALVVELPQSVVGTGAIFGPSRSLSGLLVFYLAGLLFAGLVVQADTPARSDAFWMTHPLSPTAVLGAKVLVAGVLLVGLPLGCQFVALRVHGVPSMEIFSLLGRSALVQAGLVSMALGAAVVTRDLKSYLLTLILGAVAVGILVGGVQSWLIRQGVSPNASGSTPFTAPLYVVVGASATWLQYRYRSVARTLAWVLPFLAVGLGGVMVAHAQQEGNPVFSEGEPPRPLQVQDLQVEVRDLQPGGFQGVQEGWSLIITVRAPGLPDGYRYTLYPEAWVELPDRTRRSLMLLSRPEPDRQVRVPIEGVRWRNDDMQRPRGDLGTAVLSVPRDLVEAVREGEAVLVLAGRMDVGEPRPAAELPLEVGTRVRVGDRVLALTAVDAGMGVPAVEVSAEEVVHSRQGWRASPFEDMSLTLVDGPGGVAAPLISRSGGGGQGHPLVLPTVETRRWVSGFVVPMRPSTRVADDGDWWRGGRVVFTEWRPLGTYGVTEVRLPLDLPR